MIPVIRLLALANANALAKSSFYQVARMKSPLLPKQKDILNSRRRVTFASSRSLAKSGCCIWPLSCDKSDLNTGCGIIGYYW
ncbi:hypothetical protein BDD12DRAFT_846398 [Trichophaea hybrida]|nr:hypothetical protein BDD12DRAFT_846398 [Trichophaea hybrida]